MHRPDLLPALPGIFRSIPSAPPGRRSDGQETDTHLLFHWNSSNNSPFVRAENLICMIVRIERASPADQACHLSAPVHLCRNFHGTVDSGFPELLARLPGQYQCGSHHRHHADDKTDFFAVPLIETIAVFWCIRPLPEFPGLFPDCNHSVLHFRYYRCFAAADCGAGIPQAKVESPIA